jgi:hypothetical protein
MSYQAGMIIKGESKPSTNGCFYKTEKEAQAAGNELMSRWFMPTGCEVIESDKPVNYRFNFVAYKPEMIS